MTGRKAVLAMLAILTLASCGRLHDSKLNPRNWFRHSSQTATLEPQAGYAAVAADGRLPVQSVTALEIAPNAEGAIVSATGLPPTQGWWKAELVAQNDGQPVDGVMTYDFLVAEPPASERVSTPQSREVTAAAVLSQIQLDVITSIVVKGASNSRSVRR
jgi:hypothetical protein